MAENSGLIDVGWGAPCDTRRFCWLLEAENRAGEGTAVAGKTVRMAVGLTMRVPTPESGDMSRMGAGSSRSGPRRPLRGHTEDAEAR